MIEQLISTLRLEPHPEGGWFRETYRAAEEIPAANLPDRFDDKRCFATAIYFLLDSGNFSALHRIKSDEQWHFYSGSPLTIHIIHEDGVYEPIKLGANLNAGERFQALVPHSCWFGATVDKPGHYALVGCSVAPGFDFADFELGERNALLEQFPQHAALINRLTR